MLHAMCSVFHTCVPPFSEPSLFRLEDMTFRSVWRETGRKLWVFPQIHMACLPTHTGHSTRLGMPPLLLFPFQTFLHMACLPTHTGNSTRLGMPSHLLSPFQTFFPPAFPCVSHKQGFPSSHWESQGYLYGHQKGCTHLNGFNIQILYCAISLRTWGANPRTSSSVKGRTLPSNVAPIASTVAPEDHPASSIPSPGTSPPAAPTRSVYPSWRS